MLSDRSMDLSLKFPQPNSSVASGRSGLGTVTGTCHYFGTSWVNSQERLVDADRDRAPQSLIRSDPQLLISPFVNSPPFVFASMNCHAPTSPHGMSMTGHLCPKSNKQPRSARKGLQANPRSCGDDLCSASMSSCQVFHFQCPAKALSKRLSKRDS